MKTIEVNLIGDLKQKAKPKKLAALQEKVVDSSDKPGEAKNTLILLGVGGSAILALVILIIVWLASIAFGFYYDSLIANTEQEIEKNNQELTRYTKLKKDLKQDILLLKYKEKLKVTMDRQKVSFGELLEEIRYKIPPECRLIEVKKAKSAMLIKGKVPENVSQPLRTITHFIINLNTTMPKDSLIKNAFLASVAYKAPTKQEMMIGIRHGSYEFVIKSGIKGLSAKQKLK